MTKKDTMAIERVALDNGTWQLGEVYVLVLHDVPGSGGKPTKYLGKVTAEDELEVVPLKAWHGRRPLWWLKMQWRWL